jgi:sensor histidine kinase YesM
MIVGAWTIVALISLTRHYMVEATQPINEPFWRLFSIWLTCYYSWMLLTPAVFGVARRWPLDKAHWGSNLLVHIPLSLAFTAAAVFLSHAFYLLVKQHSVVGLGAYMLDVHFVSYLKHFRFYCTTLAVANMLASFRALREKERLAAQLELERSRLETSLRQAQLDALRMQLNPHFLFNTLQTISVLMMDDTHSANRMLVQLSDLLRSTLRSSVEALSPLSEEIAFLRAYLEIEQIRFADRLRVLWDIDASTEGALIPTLLLQPLVENSIRHGIARLAAPGTITIASRSEGATLHLSIADTGPGLSQQQDEIGHGIGLTNTRKRLKQLYPEHEMEIIAGPSGGFEVHIAIPLALCEPAAAGELVTR